MTTTQPAEATRYRVQDASFVSGATTARGLPGATATEVAFAGRSNVGKSSLLNALLQRRSLVRTSRTPGCTRQINVFEAEVLVAPPRVDDASVSSAASAPTALRAHLVDLPGYGYAKRSKAEKGEWAGMIEGYLRTRPSLRGVVLLVDVRRGLEDDDRDLLAFVRAKRSTDDGRPLAPVETLVVATKLDKLGRAERKPALEAIRKDSGERVLGFSAATGEGREELWSRLRAWIAPAPAPAASNPSR